MAADLTKHAVISAIALVVAGAAVWWIQPQTAQGTAFIAGAILILLNAVGAFVPTPGKDKPKAKPATSRRKPSAH